jgi:hypothetical protein
LQVTHAPPQRTLQQRPSVQNPEAQSLSLAHTAPRGFGPQLPLTQATPGMQSSLPRHVATQLFVVGLQP